MAFATERLLGAEVWSERLDEVLAHLGAAAGADRLCCYRNVRDPAGRLWMDLCAEWDAPGVLRVFENPGDHLHPFAPDFARWIDVLSRGDLVNGIVAELPDTERAVFEGESVVSVLTVPVHSGGDWWGFLSFDDCHRPRRWTEVEIDALRTVAGALGATLTRDLNEETRRFTEHQYRSMVERGPAVTYIDGPDGSASTIFISPQIGSVLGFTPEEWVADPSLWPRLLHPDDKARAIAENERHNETGAPFRLEYRMFHKDGHVVWVHDEAMIERDERGVPRFSHGVLMDISERKESEDRVAFLT